MDEMRKKLEFIKFRYAPLLSEEDNQTEGIVYAGDIQFIVRSLEELLKKEGATQD